MVYGLGDFTAQTYEQRSIGEFDFARTLRSALCGLLAHGPLSHLYYEKLDRFFILSPVRQALLSGIALLSWAKQWECLRRSSSGRLCCGQRPYELFRLSTASEGEHPSSGVPALTRLRAQYFDGGDAWFTPLFKIAVDQTAWSVAWNSLYYVLLGERAECWTYPAVYHHQALGPAELLVDSVTA